MSLRISKYKLTREMIKDAALPAIYSRGRQYYQDGKVVDWEEHELGYITGTVRGSGNHRYTTGIDFRDGDLDCWCNCPYGWSDVCKHAVALALAYLDYSSQPLKENTYPGQFNQLTIENHNSYIPWQHALDKIVGSTAPERKTGYYRLIYRLGVTTNSQLAIELFKARIGKNGKGQEEHYYYDPMSPSTFIRDRDKAILGLFAFGRTLIYSTTYISPDITDPLLRMLAEEEYVFLGSTQIKAHIAIAPIKAGLSLIEDGENHKFEVLFYPEKINEVKDKLFILGESKPWLTNGRAFFPLEANLPGSVLRAFLKEPHVVSEDQVSLFMERYYDTLQDKNALEIKSTRIQDARDDIQPRPVLYLEGHSEGLVLKPCFAYGDGPPQVEPGTSARILKATSDGDSFWVRRRLDGEESARKMLEEAGVTLGPAGTGQLHGDDALDFLWHTVAVLKARGWEVVGEVSSLRLNRTAPKVGARISSGIDWFDLNLEVGYGDSLLDISTVLAAYKSGRKYIQLDDDSWAPLPLDWLHKVTAPLEELADLEGQEIATTANNGKLKLRSHNIPLAEEILSGIDLNSIASFDMLRERLDSFEGIEKVDIPHGLEATLRGYQKDGLDWLGFLSSFSFNGILADDMGLGKTVQTLAHLLREKNEGRAAKPSLIVAPTSVSYNWKEESLRFTPDLKVLVLTGPERHQRFEGIASADIVITTYALLRRDFEELQKHEYHYIILDEAQFIKNPAAQTSKLCKRLTGNHRLALTGTPMENNLTEVWSIFDFLMPGLLSGHKSFQKRYEKPIAKTGDMVALQRLKRRLKPFILRRVKQDVAKELPPKTEIIAYCEMTSSQRTLYQQVLNTYRAKVFESIAKKGIERSHITILDALLKLRQVCNHPQLLKVAPHKVKTSGKMELFEEMVGQLANEGHRALVFSQFTQMLALLKRWLDSKNIPYCYLDGRTRDRSKVIKKFNEGDVPLFLISLKAGGTGLNLTAADYVIHLDPWWNPAVENQATDRAYRIGQDKHVFVYKMITKDSIEEKILKLQERKKALFDNFLSEGDVGKSLTKDDLEELFRRVDV
ncbi:DEAD/DEAH box helicase [Candidatus Aquicultor sp.]